jgi:hypothetical protein
MSTETIKLKPKADVIAQFRYNAKVQAMGVFEANGMVSPHGHDATNREKRLPLIASDHPVPPFTQLNPEQVSVTSGRMFGASTIRLRGSWRPILQPAPALACAKDSIRVTAGLRRTDLFQSGGCLIVQLQLGCAEVVAKMLDRARTDDRSGDAWAVCDPAQRDLGRRHADLLGDAHNGIDRRPIAIGAGIPPKPTDTAACRKRRGFPTVG